MLKGNARSKLQSANLKQAWASLRQSKVATKPGNISPTKPGNRVVTNPHPLQSWGNSNMKGGK